VVAPNLRSQDGVLSPAVAMASQVASPHLEITATVIAYKPELSHPPLPPLMAEMALGRRLIEAVGHLAGTVGLLMRQRNRARKSRRMSAALRHSCGSSGAMPIAERSLTRICSALALRLLAGLARTVDA